MKSGAVQENMEVPLTGPPDNATKIIPGLTLHLPSSKKELRETLHGPLFTLFESCVRSKLKLKLRSLFDEEKTQWVVFLLIEDELISKGISESNVKLTYLSYDSSLHCTCLSKAKILAANQALDCLKNCPQKQNSHHESFIRPGETIPGLKLYLDGPSPAREDCLALLTQSCHKCNLPLTWWDDDGCNVFKSSCITILLINSKPICFAWGDNLEQSKKETAAKAVSLLKIRHEVVSKEKDAVTKQASGLAEDLKPSIDIQLVKNEADEDPISPLVTQPFVFGVDKKPTSLIQDHPLVCSPCEDSKSSIIEPVGCELKEDLKPLLDNHSVLFEANEVPNFQATYTVVPGLTLYFRDEQRVLGSWIDAWAAINRSVFRCHLDKKFRRMGKMMRNGKLVFATTLVIGDTVVAWGYGNSRKSSRQILSYSANMIMASLLRTQSVVRITSEPVSKGARKRERRRMAKATREEKEKEEKERKRKLLNFLNDDLDNIHKREENEHDKLYYVHSEWMDTESGGVETRFDSDEIIRRYMECL